MCVLGEKSTYENVALMNDSLVNDFETTYHSAKTSQRQHSKHPTVPQSF